MTASHYDTHGYAVFPFLDEESFECVKKYAVAKLSDLFKHYRGLEKSAQEIANYHLEEASEAHGPMLKAANRHWNPPIQIQKAILNERFILLLKELGAKNYQLWDEGLGWLGFRLIRPGYNDGYPFSCKNWGPAKNVISFWIPLIGFDPALSLNIMPGSHKKEFPKYLPAHSQFTSDEYRLNYQPHSSECVRPSLLPGEAIIFHPRTIHAEQSAAANETRFSLEFRILPL